ncbi:RICIN domain-containing protein [Micromonospora tulbaghiae]
MEGGVTTAGARIIQWTCTGGTNQRWRMTPRADGAYTMASVRSGLLLTAGSLTDGAPVTQQPDTGSTLQRWVIG